MKNTYKIYSAIHPSIEKTVSLKERIKYLRCKFWKASKDEAEYFFNFYLGPVIHELHRPVGILCGQFLRQNKGEDAYDKIRKSVDLYRINPKEKYFERYPKHKIIIEAICDILRATYPKESLVDDVLVWAFKNHLINNNEFCLAKLSISNTRVPVFKTNRRSEEICIEIIKIFIDKGRYIYLGDIFDLLHCSSTLLPEIYSAVKLGKIIATVSADTNTIYFEIQSLLKWLLVNNHLNARLAEEFLYLKIEAIKENRVDYNGIFQSLSKLVKKGDDRNDLLSDALNNKIQIYLKYPRNYLYWRNRVSNISSDKEQKNYAKHRYNGLGQLKINKNEDTHFCQFGGLTVDMLLYGEHPLHGLSKSIPEIEYEIEFIPTEEEYNAGLQPYLKISKYEMNEILSDENLMVVSLDENILTDDHADTKQLIDHMSSMGVDENADHYGAKKLIKCNKQKIWSELFSELHQKANSIQKGNKMEVVDTSISLILNTIKIINPDFNPMKMPGTVQDFHQFCLSIPCGSKIFPSGKNSFGKYCRRTLCISEQKLPPHCAWDNPPTPDNQFWESLKPKDTSYIVRSMAFT